MRRELWLLWAVLLMFPEKDYICCCHGCGAFHVVRASFLSSPQAASFSSSTPGRTWCVPLRGCPECLAEGQRAPIVDGRHMGRIGRAYTHGMTPDARERAQREFTEWEPRLDAEKGRS